MKEALFPRRDNTRRGGFTLVEVVIALAIFVFGALAIIRIFPPALGVIQNSGDKLTALNLNRTTLARFAKESSSVPSAVHNIYYTPAPAVGVTATPTPIPASAVVGSAIRNASLPKRNQQVIDDSALDHFKYITGEKQKVREVVVDVAGTPVTINYVLTSFPVANYVAPGVVAAPGTSYPPDARVYKETEVTGVVAETRSTGPGGARQSGYLNFTDAEPSLTSGNLPAAAENFYHISYQYLEDGVLNAVTDEVVRSTTPNGASPPITIDNARLLQGRRFTDSPAAPLPLFNSRVVDGPVRVRFRRQYVNPTTNVNISSDTTPLPVQNTLNNLGVIVVTGVTGINVGDEVSIDYRINDWRQIVHSGVPSIKPETTPLTGSPAPTVRTDRELVLPLRALSDGADGTTASAATTYSLLSYINPALVVGTNTNPVTLQANAIDTADTLATTTPDDPANPIDQLSLNNVFFLWNLNRKGGRLVFDVNNRVNTAEQYQVLQSRVVFQTLDNWAHQVSVAPTNYTPFYDVSVNNSNIDEAFTGTITGSNGVNVAQPWRYYSWRRTSSQPGRIFFPPSETGKTISLSYVYTVGGVEREVNNAIVTINNVWIRRSDAPAEAQLLSADPSTSASEWLAYAEPQLTGSTSLPIVAIRSIKGVSIQARTAWLDGSNFSQVSTVGFRGDSTDAQTTQ